MPLSDLDFGAIGDEALTLFKDELGDGWEALQEEHKEEATRLVKDLAMLAAKAIADPTNAEAYAEEAAFTKSSLASRAWMAEMDVEERMKKAAWGALAKVAGIVLAAL